MNNNKNNNKKTKLGFSFWIPASGGLTGLAGKALSWPGKKKWVTSLVNKSAGSLLVNEMTCHRTPSLSKEKDSRLLA
jgi:hypothetical protein